MRSSIAKGVTLIEVVAGLALMGTLLTLILVSGSRHLRQSKAARDKIDSARQLDDFLAAWSISEFSEAGIPDAVARSGLSATGFYGDHEFAGAKAARSGRSSADARVQIRKARNSSIPGAMVLRLTVSVPADRGQRFNAAWAEVLASR